VQEALDKAVSDIERELLVAELHGHAVQAMRCPHANHVLQRCIATMRPEALDFILEELLAKAGVVANVARHRYGCRVVSLLLKHCPASQSRGLAEALLREAQDLARHPIGNTAIRQLLASDSEEVRYRVVRSIEQNVGAISRSKVGGLVLLDALTRSLPEDQLWLARALAMDFEGLVSLVGFATHGDAVAVRLLQLLRGRELLRLQQQLVDRQEELERCNRGRALLDHLRAQQ